MTIPLAAMSWRAARDALTGSGRGANEAQQILDDLAHWGPGVREFSYRADDGAVRWLRYAGLGADGQPQYAVR